MKHIVGLNSLRFFAAMLVLVFHCNDGLRQVDPSLFRHYPILQKGYFAVDYFFILSGFLIAALALFEKLEKGSFSVRLFFIRRILRIFPLYYLSVMLGLGLMGWVYPHVYGETFFDFDWIHALLYYILFLPNLVIVLWENVGPTYSLWSIGVEEQFYLMFPIILFAIFKARRKVLMIECLLVSYLGIYLSTYMGLLDFGDRTNELIVQTLRFHFFFLGILLGYLFVRHRDHQLFLFIERPLTQLLVLVGLIIYFFLMFNNQDPHNFIGSTLFSILMVNIARGKSLLAFHNRSIEYLGLISFGIYVFHPYVSIFFRYIMDHNIPFRNLIFDIPIIFYLLVTTLTIGISTISYRYYESYFINLKRRYLHQ